MSLESIAKFLQYYKRRDVEEAIVRHAQGREVAPRYGGGFGKRPDTLQYAKDVLEFAKRKATSFHCSEERWHDPMLIETGMSRKQADELRSGWDLVLDIDATDWEISRLTGFLFVTALRDYGIEGITVKFSGNKGWHIGVAWESFPETIIDDEGNELVSSDLFPELPRAIAQALLEHIEEGLIAIEDDAILFGPAGGQRVRTGLAELAGRLGVGQHQLVSIWCSVCKARVEGAGRKHALLCPSCGSLSGHYSEEEKEMLADHERACPKCRRWRDFHLVSRESGCTHDRRQHQTRFRIDEVVQIDTVLLASRHLYRMAYSLHEKSGLASVPIGPDEILSFRKEQAAVDAISFEKSFLDPALAVRGEATQLVREAWQRHAPQKAERREFEVPEEAIPEEHFPPCMQRILAGLKDGRKRAMFALSNFLVLAGWSEGMIEDRLLRWNEANAEPLKEVVIRSHVRQLRRKSERFPPPNCKEFYREIGVCYPDALCSTIRNPAQYARKKGRMGE